MVFPECAITGYAAVDAEETRRIAIDPAFLEPLRGRSVLLGALQREEGGVHNVAILFLPDGSRHEYRKTHLPFMGADRFCVPGDRLEPVDTPWGRLGVLVCFDLRFPEAARSLALRGADLILVPTNWPQGAEVSADHVALARAAENRVFVATCNRVGTERSFRFVGRSKIVGLDGVPLAAAGEARRRSSPNSNSPSRARSGGSSFGRVRDRTSFARRPELYALERTVA